MLCLMTRIFCLVTLSAGLAGAQALTEYAIIGAGATAAAAGKGAGNSIGSIFNKLKTQMDAAQTKPETGSVSKTGEHSNPSRAPSASAPITGLAATAEAAAATPEPPTVEVLAAIKVGTTRKELLAKAGKPTSSASTVEHGQFVEVCWYTAKDTAEASIRLVDGVVTAVRISGRQ